MICVIVGVMVNPARAGMIPVNVVVFECFCGKPRASGDDPAYSVAVFLLCV